MSEHDGFLTAHQFAEHMGINPSTVSKWLRAGKLSGVKKGGKWLINRSQLDSTVAASRASSEVPRETQPTAMSTQHNTNDRIVDSSLSVAEFSARTYLTEYGVQKWLKEGRLRGFKKPDGAWRVDAANLELKDIKHLLRKQ